MAFFKLKEHRKSCGVKNFTMKRLIVVAGVILAVIVGLVLLLRGKPTAPLPSPDQDAKVLLVGFTNIPPKGRFAMFTFTNGTQRPIVVTADAVEEFVSGAWRRSELRGRARRWIAAWVGFREYFRPGEGCVFFVPPPVTNVSWKVVLHCQERAPIIDAGRDAVRHITDTNAAAHQDQVFSGRKYVVITPQVPE